MILRTIATGANIISGDPIGFNEVCVVLRELFLLFFAAHLFDGYERLDRPTDYLSGTSPLN